MQNQTEHWMGFLPSLITARLITEICMPSSHDSGSYAIDFFHPIATDNNALLKLSYLIGFVSPVKYITRIWTLTQNLDIYGQLVSGIRVLDLRLAFDGERFWLVHAFSLVKLSKALKQIKLFMETHPTEVIIIRMKKGWEQRNTMYTETNRLEAFVIEKLGREMLMIPEHGLSTLQNCQKYNKRILLVYEIPSYYFWPEYTVQGFWGNTNVVDELMDNINSAKTIPKRKEVFQEISFTLTPTKYDIEQSILKYITFRNYKSLKTFAKVTNEILVNEIHDDPVNYSKFSVISMDYPSSEAIIAIIAMNYR